MHYVIFYDLAPDYLETRLPHREAHLAHAWAAQERGELVLAGPLADPADSAVLIFDCESATVPERFAEADPYVVHGVVTGYTVRLWKTAVGDEAKNPARPERAARVGD